jgi:hypothetical protein
MFKNQFHQGLFFLIRDPKYLEISGISDLNEAEYPALTFALLLESFFL